MRWYIGRSVGRSVGYNNVSMSSSVLGGVRVVLLRKETIACMLLPWCNTKHK